MTEATPGRWWYLATCRGCEGETPLPFDDEEARNEWGRRHAVATGHVVVTTREPRPVGDKP
jgi:hypothetical protein